MTIYGIAAGLEQFQQTSDNQHQVGKEDKWYITASIFRQ
jgi:hypothetical protein